MSTAVLNNNFTSVDSGIMARKKDEAEESGRAGALREQQMMARRNEENERLAEEQREMSLREQVMIAKRDQKVQAETAKKTESKRMNSMQRGTGALLRTAWLVLIPSFGLSLIWINIHALMRMIPGFSSAFCKIGDEWMPGEIKEVAGEGVRQGVGITEKAGIFFLDIMAGLVLLIFVMVVIMIVDLVSGVFGWVASIIL